MKITIIWDSQESKQMFLDLSSIKEQYEVKDSLVLIQQIENNQNLKIPAMILEEESIWFTDILSEWETMTKEALRQLVEELFWIVSTSGGCSSGGCGSCSSWC